MAEQTKEATTAKGVRTSAVQLPAMSFTVVRPILEELKKTGIPMKRASLSDRLQVSVKSSGFIQKIATAKYFGLLDQVGEKLTITERGERFVDGDVSAAQEGFMSSAFGQLTGDLVGRTVDEGMIALHLSEKLGVPSASAPRFAGIFLRTAAEVELLRDDRLNAERIEELEDLVVESPTERQPAKRPAVTSPKAASTSSTPQAAQKRSVVSQVSPSMPSGHSANGGSGVSLVLHLHTAPLTLEDSLKLLETISKNGIDAVIRQDNGQPVSGD